MTRGSFRTADGCELGYVDEGAGLPVLWQHGLGATQAQPAEVFPEAAGSRRITLECRGHAESALGDPEALSIPQFADDALRLLDLLAVRRAIVGGISLGAAIALRLAARHPERVGGLIIARPAWVDESVPERLRIYRDVAELLARHGPGQGLLRFLETERYQQLARESPDNAASLRSFFRRAHPESTVALLNRIPAQGSGVSRAELSRLTAPTLVIANEGDHVHSIEMATELAGLIPGAGLQIIPRKDAPGGAYVQCFKTALAEFLSGRQWPTL